MAVPESLGVLAHRGGLVVRRPELTVGIVQIISRLSGLDVDLLARRPPNQQSGRSPTTPAARRLLPVFDEGRDLRVGWLDRQGRSHWNFGTVSSRRRTHADGAVTANWRTKVTFPAMFDKLSLVLAWPEIGFPETVLTVPLPDRTTVERHTTPLWTAPTAAVPVTESLTYRSAPIQPEVAIEAGTVVASQQVLYRGSETAIVLTRLTATDKALSAELTSIATTPTLAGAVPSTRESDAGRGPSMALIHEREAFWIRPRRNSSTSGKRGFRNVQEFTMWRPDNHVLNLALEWPLAELDEVRARIPLEQPK
ncbi:MAG: hypothetical protein GEU98_27060 [Pseudonocardiaceae bacterium]|nr:hypothetical protein [Pseudonocardiaceae bacterium]